MAFVRHTSQGMLAKLIDANEILSRPIEIYSPSYSSRTFFEQLQNGRRRRFKTNTYSFYKPVFASPGNKRRKIDMWRDVSIWALPPRLNRHHMHTSNVFLWQTKGPEDDYTCIYYIIENDITCDKPMRRPTDSDSSEVKQQPLTHAFYNKQNKWGTGLTSFNNVCYDFQFFPECPIGVQPTHLCVKQRLT